MFSFRALVSIIFFSSIAVVLLKLVFRNNKAILRMDIRFLLACMLLILFRMFVPIESPITNNIPIYRIYPDVYRLLRKQIWNTDIKVLDLLGLIWLAGAVIAMVILVISYTRLLLQVNRLEEIEDSRIADIVAKIGKEHGRKTKFRLLLKRDARTPFVVGILKPNIVIPETEISDMEAYLILKHEMLHYYRGDTAVKILCEILKAIYWWNPFMYMLSRLVSDTQEINVDFQVSKGLSYLEQLEYTQCLVNAAKKRESGIGKSNWLVSFHKESPLVVRKRISLIIDNMKISRKKTAASIFLSTVILGLVVLCPNLIIFEPYSIPEELVDMSVGGREGGICGVDNKDGTYDIYMDGIYLKTISKYEIADENIRLYDSLEDIK